MRAGELRGKRQLNVEVDEEVYQAARKDADQKGMKLREWVSRAIKAAVAAPKERTYEPIGDG